MARPPPQTKSNASAKSLNNQRKGRRKQYQILFHSTLRFLFPCHPPANELRRGRANARRWGPFQVVIFGSVYSNLSRDLIGPDFHLNVY